MLNYAEQNLQGSESPFSFLALRFAFLTSKGKLRQIILSTVLRDSSDPIPLCSNRPAFSLSFHVPSLYLPFHSRAFLRLSSFPIIPPQDFPLHRTPNQKPTNQKMKKYTRKQFAEREDNLKKMRKNDPIQFDVLYREYCRLKKLTPTSTR
jgi:hypothetical protein